MIRRLSVILLATVVLLFSCSSTTFACNEAQTNTYITQMLFGNNALRYTNDDDVKMLLSALYLCSEQSDGLGQDKIDYLSSQKVSGVPALSALNINRDGLMACAHNSWEYHYLVNSKCQDNRRNLLQNTVAEVFDFGLMSNLFGDGKEKCYSFSALLYYAHILSDYLADDPAETETNVNGKLVAAYSGQPYIIIDGNKPSFTDDQKMSTTSFVNYSAIDNLGRAGVVFANIGLDTVNSVGPRKSMVNIKPSGWSFNRYEGIVNSQPAYLYNRCHLLAHSLGGVEQEKNLVTGTRYLNETGMLPFEEKVTQYIKKTGNHVLYRVTPIFTGNNKLVSGVQIEAYSVEDAGKGVCFNVYCYNVQPGVDLNYANGDNEVSDVTFGTNDIIPFAQYNASQTNPDLIFEMNKHLEILFKNQKNTSTYISMMNEINSIAIQARMVGNSGENAAQCYIASKGYQYKYFDVLKAYIPILFQKEEFFYSTFM